MTGEKSNVGKMPELADFRVVHSALGEFVVMHSRYRDPMAQWFTPVDYPDLVVSMKLDKVKSLIAELQNAVDMIEASIEHPSCRTDL